MKKKLSVLGLIIGVICTSCGGDYPIQEEDLKYIPYVDNEVLIFKSDLNRTDTIFLKGLQRFNACYDPMTFFPDDCEGYEMKATKTDPNYNRYLEGSGLISLAKSKDGHSYFYFNITLKGSWFYSMEGEPLSLHQFDSIPTNTIKIGNKQYKDVKIINADGRYSKRDNYAERFYWSVSEGFLGLDRRDEKWRLVKKYVP